MENHIIAGIHIENRETHASLVQEIFTRYGSQINTRLGLHDNINPSNGLILLEMNDSDQSYNLISELEAIEGVDCKMMVFAH